MPMSACRLLPLTPARPGGPLARMCAAVAIRTETTLAKLLRNVKATAYLVGSPPRRQGGLMADDPTQLREDYSGDECDAWDYFPHDMARSRAYRWSEDGLAGFSDVEQRLCLALALWNGNDPILKERLYGVAGPEGNHGEDAKEYWWFVDAVPSHAWNRWRYHYPHDKFPYADLARGYGKDQTKPELELLDTGVFEEDRYWVVE